MARRKLLVTNDAFVAGSEQIKSDLLIR